MFVLRVQLKMKEAEHNNVKTRRDSSGKEDREISYPFYA
jgi:hypothetical protein